MTSESSPLTRILVVDDDEDDCFMMRDLLSAVPNQRFQVDWQPTYEAGLDALRGKKHDLSFLDYRLGVKTGLDLLEQVIGEGIQTPLVLLTGYGEQEVDLRAMELGAADYLVKDQISAPLLERCVRYSLHRARSKQALLEREAQIRLQDRLASVGLLASSLAHEVGTPLGVIRGRAEYLGMQLGEQPNLKKSTEIIITQIDRVSQLIRSLLNLARGDEGKIASKVMLNQVLGEVLDLMRHELEKHHIQVTNEVTSDMEVRVKARTAPLHQVFLNLLVNSLHAIQAAQKDGRISGHAIRISAKDTGSTWCLSIADTGCGISPENKKKLFQAFFTTKDIGVGTGLGLATSYQIVQSWGGNIQVESVESQGATFSVYLPKAAP